MLAFADRSGWLGLPERGAVGQQSGESLDLWLEHVRRTDRAKRLSDGAGRLRRTPSEKVRRELQALLRDTPLEPASTVTNSDLAGRADGMARFSVESTLADKLAFRIGSGRIEYGPRHLLGAIYLALALRVSGASAAERTCARKRCGGVFRPTRRNQEYCSPSCKQMAYVERRRASGD